MVPALRTPIVVDTPRLLTVDVDAKQHLDGVSKAEVAHARGL
jgi:hypothetical protein